MRCVAAPRMQTAVICPSSVQIHPGDGHLHSQHLALERNRQIVHQHGVKAGDALAFVVAVNGRFGDQGVQRCPFGLGHPARLSYRRPAT